MMDAELLKKRLERERQARKEAESILEHKALELYAANEKLRQLNDSKDSLLGAVSKALTTLFKEQDLDNALKAATLILAKSGFADRISLFRIDQIKEKTISGIFSNTKSDSIPELHTSKVNKPEFQVLLFNLIQKLSGEQDSLPLLKSDQAASEQDQYLQMLGLCSAYMIPIRYKERNFAIISIDFFDREYEWSRSEESILLTFATGVESAAERYFTRREIERGSKRLSTLIQNLNSGILLEDQNRNILVTNKEFCEMFEIPAEPEQLVGKDCSDSAEQSKHLVEEPDAFVESINRIVRERKPVLNEEIVFNSGQVFLRDFIPIYNNDFYLGHLWEYRDITFQKESFRQLIRAREQAEESKRLKQKFLANMSHEIRTPMNGVVGIVHLLERTQLDNEQKKYLDILKDSSEHLLHLINDILDVSKIEEGKLVLAKSPVQLDNIIEGVVQNLRSRVEDKNLNLKLEGLDIFDTLLITDPVRIRQILLNLLSNAIKFTHQGSIALSCKSIQKTGTHHKFSIEVSDTGIGISPEKLKHIFTAFDQENRDISNQYGGTGLGLNIVKELVDKMGGEIKVQSELNKGSSFTISLNLEISAKTESPFDRESASRFTPDALKGKCILIADDHEINYTIAAETISVLGADILYARNGEEAVSRVLEHDIDLILMDMQMPKVDGIEATRMIRLLNPEKANVPIIAMTAAALPEERERCLQSGMNDYISKPYNPNILFQILFNHLLETDPEADETIEDFEIKDKAENDALFDLSYVKDLSGNNTKFILSMINSFQSEMPEMISDMVMHVEKKEFRQVGQIAHKASSLAGYLGCSHLRTLLQHIESVSEKKPVPEEASDFVYKASAMAKKINEQLNKVEI
jgi:signal transduction histidine kinase/response regulator of citrate/malate metabolism/GAF domain-containing protein